ncbi:uncharacterized protein AruCF_1501 [Achromobacter ruhlandii]|nr:uncharacterized protein AruCF_1501 [Achromobacter ruhlandii]
MRAAFRTRRACGAAAPCICRPGKIYAYPPRQACEDSPNARRQSGQCVRH